MISNSGGTQPRWRRDGKEILYLAANGEMTAVEVRTNPIIKAGTPKALFRAPILGFGTGPFGGLNWDVTPDGQRFLINTAAETSDPGASTINVVLNWTGLLKR